MRFLFKPGWVAFILLVIAFAVACYTLLAPWQFRRNAERAEQNREISAATSQPPRPLAQLVPPGSAPAPSVQWRQAVVHGEYLPADEAVVRLRTVLGRPAFEVLTAFRANDGRVVAVDRGYVRPGDGRQVAPYPPAPGGPVSLTGRIRLDEADPQHRQWFTAGGHRQLYAADSQLLGAAVGLPVTPGYLQLVDNQPGGLGVLPLPDTDSGPFLSYAWQWLTFGAMALFGLVYFIRLELLQRRAEQEFDTPAEQPSARRGPSVTPGATTASETSSSAESARSGSASEQTADLASERTADLASERTADLASERTADLASEPTSGRLASEPASGRLASVRARRAALREALRGAPDSGAPTVPDEPAPDRQRLAERYGKSRF